MIDPDTYIEFIFAVFFIVFYHRYIDRIGNVGQFF